MTVHTPVSSKGDSAEFPKARSLRITVIPPPWAAVAEGGVCCNLALTAIPAMIFELGSTGQSSVSPISLLFSFPCLRPMRDHFLVLVTGSGCSGPILFFFGGGERLQPNNPRLGQSVREALQWNRVSHRLNAVPPVALIPTLSVPDGVSIDLRPPPKKEQPPCHLFGPLVPH